MSIEYRIHFLQLILTIDIGGYGISLNPPLLFSLLVTSGIFADFLFVITKAILMCSVAEILNDFSECNFPYTPYTHRSLIE